MIDIDEEYDVPRCYVEFFRKAHGSGRNNSRQEEKAKIVITVENSKWKRNVTKIKNLNLYVSDIKSFIKEIKNRFGTNCNIESDIVIIQGDFVEKIRELLIEEYKVSENDIQQQKTDNKEDKETRIAINIITYKDSKMVISNLPEEIVKWFSNKQKSSKTFHSRCIVSRESSDVQVIIESTDTEKLFKFLEKNGISEEEYDIFENGKKISKDHILPKEPIYKTNNSYPELPCSILYNKNVKLISKNESLRFYFYNNLEFIRAQFNEAKLQKSALILENFELEFIRVSTINDSTIWNTRFTANSDLLSLSDETQSGSNNHICINDGVTITWPGCMPDEKMTGKVINITSSGIVIVQLKLFKGFTPPDYNDKYSVLKDGKTPEVIKYTITFQPNETIYKRRTIALKYLIECMNGNLIRDFIVLRNPSTNVNIDEIDGSFDLTNSELSTDIDQSKLVFDATSTQNLAISMAMKNAITLIQGPPGCGKTITATAIAVAMLRRMKINEKKRIMICCQSNTAVENFVKVLGPPVKALGKKITWVAANAFDFKNKKEFLNANDEQKVLLCYQSLIRETQEGKRYREIKEKIWSKHEISSLDVIDQNKYESKIERNIVYESDIICCTLESSMKKCLDSIIFDTIIIDEATQAVEVASILPIVHHPNKLILVGDQKQLGPIITGEANLDKFHFKSSLFVRLLGRGFNHIMLDVQYRMHPIISELPNRLFYDGEIIDGINEDSRLCPSVTNMNLPITYYNCEGECVKQLFSYKNQKEAELIERIIKSLLKQGNIKPKEIGVISFYSAQVRHLKKKLEKLNPYNEIKIATVDSFQGSERDFIIISLVLTNPDIIRNSFILDKRRLNVAITRAKRGLIIVGNENALRKASLNLWDKIFKYIDERSSASDPSFLVETIKVERNKHDKKIIFENNSNDDSNPFKEDAKKSNSGFNMKEVESSITKGKFKILWPDDEDDCYYLKKYVEEIVEKMNKGTKIIIAYDAESVCIQFGQVFPDNFEPSAIQSIDDDIPSIGKAEGIIAFFYAKETSEKNDTLMKIVKPLFEHKNITILTFDFTFDLEILQKFGINPNLKGIIDSQFIDYKINEEDKDNNSLIIETNVSSLKALLKDIQYQGEFSKAAQNEIEENKEKDFPFNENRFIMKITKVPKTSVVTKKFLGYSANDVPLTGLIFADVLYQNKFNYVKELTQQKLKDYNEAKSKVGKASLLREATFLSKDKNSIIHHVINEDTKASELILLWNQITSVKKLLSKNNKIINKIFRFEKEQIKGINQKYEKIEKALQNQDEWETLCTKAELTIPPNVKPAEREIEL